MNKIIAFLAQAGGPQPTFVENEPTSHVKCGSIEVRRGAFPGTTTRFHLYSGDHFVRSFETEEQVVEFLTPHPAD